MALLENRQHIIHGLRDGTPIAMGYFAVAFSLGIIAAKAGLTAPEGFLTSFFTRASAGEYGTYTLVAVQATYVEVIVMCMVVNLRYLLMSAALSQKIAPGTSWLHRILMACCVTDEVFGISVAEESSPVSCAREFRERDSFLSPLSSFTRDSIPPYILGSYKRLPNAAFSSFCSPR